MLYSWAISKGEQVGAKRWRWTRRRLLKRFTLFQPGSSRVKTDLGHQTDTYYTSVCSHNTGFLPTRTCVCVCVGYSRAVPDGKHRPLPPRYAPNQAQITQKEPKPKTTILNQKRVPNNFGRPATTTTSPPPPLVGAVWRICTGHFRLLLRWQRQKKKKKRQRRLIREL